MKLIIFDLDGTLIDSALDIARSVNAVREQLDYPPLPNDLIESYVGDGIRMLVERAFDGAPRALVAEAQNIYPSFYRDRLLDNTRAYPGVRETLRALQSAGRRMAVLTNKPRRESLMILRGLALAPYFRTVYGGDSFANRKPDPGGVHRLLDEGGHRCEEALFVGDSRVDLETARNAGMRCCLVTYGIGGGAPHEPAAALAPDFSIDRMQDLLTIPGVSA